ncbi:MAG: hypothetical protein DWQ04_32510 [Chloroflexi bacterium]|nr:MAG: hypothetical protein DWQ04_32510 [Chloroflexota bacterium]
MSRQDDIKQLVTQYQRRLQKLREQRASFGLTTPPHILMEIEDIEAEIAKLQAELALLNERVATTRLKLDEDIRAINQSDTLNKYSVQKELEGGLYKFNIFREEYLPGSLKDFQALMHEIYQLQPQYREDSIFLQGERTPSDYPENMGRWEVTLGGTLHKRGFILARQLPNGTTKLQFANYSKFDPIGSQFDIEFVNQILKQDILQVEVTLASENRRRFHQNLIDHFNTEELRMVAFEMHIKHENFSSKLDSFARELIEYCERHQRIEELKEICQENRPSTAW